MGRGNSLQNGGGNFTFDFCVLAREGRKRRLTRLPEQQGKDDRLDMGQAAFRPEAPARCSGGSFAVPAKSLPFSADAQDAEGEEDHSGPEGHEGKQAGSDRVWIAVGPDADFRKEDDGQHRSVAEHQKEEAEAE